MFEALINAFENTTPGLFVVLSIPVLHRVWRFVVTGVNWCGQLIFSIFWVGRGSLPGKKCSNTCRIRCRRVSYRGFRADVLDSQVINVVS